MSQDSDTIASSADGEPTGPGIATRWCVLIVDDDEDVHLSTRLALRDVIIDGRGLEFLQARSAESARELLASHSDRIAVVLLDVVMETPDAGLLLVRFIRETLGCSDTRIILRTGQPGYAPELSAVRDYDINDYRTKSELTRDRLVTMLTTAIRSYAQIRAIEASRRGLDLIVKATSNLLSREGLAEFAAGVITQLAGLLGVAPEGIVCAQAVSSDGRQGELIVLAAAGRFAPFVHKPVQQLDDPEILRLLNQAIELRQPAFGTRAAAIWCGGRGPVRMVALVDGVSGHAAPEPSLIQVFCNNVSVCLENVGLMDQMRDFAYVDWLVGMANRLALINELDKRIAAGEGDNLTLALLDIDDFSAINNAFGHEFGDQLLQAFGARLREHGDGHWSLARLSSDTFAILGVHDHVNPRVIREAIGQSLTVGGQGQPITFTMGLLRLGEGSGSGNDLLKDASIALKRAKAASRHHEIYFSPFMATEIRDRVRLLADLRDAFDRRQLFVVYQPQIDLASRRMIGAEALLRWQREDGSFIPPDRFIPLAEYSGLIVELGAWVLEQACAMQCELARSGLPGVRMAVNVSVAQFRDERLVSQVKRAIEQAGIDPRLVELEITESVTITGEGTFFDTLNALRTLGVQLAIDDFGTGYSSLSYLHRLKVDRLKIDSSFVHELEAQAGGGTGIAETVVRLGHTLGLAVIAEGIETESQASLLRGMGCHEGQGYLYARPMRGADLLAWAHREGAPGA